MSKTNNNISKKLIYSIILSTALVIIEFTGGIISGSLSLISDATHNSIDVITLIITYFADKISKKKQIKISVMVIKDLVL